MILETAALFEMVKAADPRRNSIGRMDCPRRAVSAPGRLRRHCYLGWTLESADLPTSGYAAMAFGVIFSLAFGIGLMALVFYSSR